MTNQFYMGLTKMAGMNCLTFLALVASLLGVLVLKKLRGAIYQIYFEKWQSEHEGEHQTLTWLLRELERDCVHGHMASWYSVACRKYEST